MPRLVLHHTCKIHLPRIEANKSLRQLSPEQISKTVKEAIRYQCSSATIELLVPTSS